MQSLWVIPIMLLFSISFNYPTQTIVTSNANQPDLEISPLQFQATIPPSIPLSQNVTYSPLHQLGACPHLRRNLFRTTNQPKLVLMSALTIWVISYIHISPFPASLYHSFKIPDTQLDSTSPSIPIPAIEVTLFSFIYLFIALIGFFVAIIINFNPTINTIAKALISSFIFIHSFFIFHIFFSLTNFQYHFPNSYRMSTIFSFLYGPLLYFYFKRITQDYKFKAWDLLHLLPSLVLAFYLVPIYLLTKDEKLALLLAKASGEFTQTKDFEVITLVATKLLSLVVYGILIARLYLKSKYKTLYDQEHLRWQKYILGIHIVYVVAYAIYGFMIINNLYSNLLFHAQIIAMALMVLYIAYSAYIQPNVFSAMEFTTGYPFHKYEKSGLTDSLSLELKSKILQLMENEKIYKENNLNLEQLADKLNTNRHNTSQVINEHFNQSFHELVNTYRINEAKQLLKDDKEKSLNIIEIAYEVGYNNKATFNKAFKKYTNLTPSQFQKKQLSSRN